MSEQHDGHVFGHYRLKAPIGRGGFGKVYLGEHVHLGSPAAIKLLNRSLSTDEDGAFVHEAQLLARLKHPHIIRLLDFGCEAQQWYLVMEYAPFGTLCQRHPRGTCVPLAEVTSYIQVIASALQYLHEQQIVHGDLKPENCLLDTQEQVCLADFGLARLFDPTSVNSTVPMDQPLGGTPLYQAPEQLRGHMQPASDQYALAVMVYEWLTGRPPFEGTALQIATQHIIGTPLSLRAHCPNLSEALENVLLRALAKEPEQRFDSVQGFANAILHAQYQTTLIASSIDNYPSQPQSAPLSRFSPLPRLPLPLTKFVGRTRELEEIKQRLSSTRLLTLTGPGGCGKTRIALEIVSDLENTFADGVYFVDLTPLSEPVHVPRAVASVFGLREQTKQPLVDLLAHLLAEKQMLLLLDNCEQVVMGCARLAERLLQTCPHLRLLITSREALGVGGEVLWRVPALSFPSSDAPRSLEQISRYEAVQLFLDRAQARQPAFRLTDENMAAVIEICQRLEGMPLALELAAARMHVLSPQQIADRLSDQFRLLVNQERLTSPRHQTLYATLDWSYQLLSPSEQYLLRCLAVFVGGFSLESIEAICAGENLAREDVLDVLDHLITKSLVLVIPSRGQEEQRYRLLETIRQYCQHQVQVQNEATAVELRHATYFLRFAEELAPHLNEKGRIKALHLLEREHDNLRAALTWSLATAERTEIGLRLVAALYWFWFHQGYVYEGRQWIEQILASGKGNEASPARAKAYAGAGALAWLQDDLSIARAQLEMSVDLWREMQERREMAGALPYLGQVLTELGELAQAQTVLEESIALSQQFQERHYQATAYNFLGNVFRKLRNYAQARDAYEHSVALYHLLEDDWGEAIPLWNLGMTAFRQGDYQRAAALLRESFRLNWHQDERWFFSLVLQSLAAVANAQGDYRRAARLLGADQALREGVGASVQHVRQALYESTLAALRAALDEASMAAAWEEGRAMTREQVYALAMAEEVLTPEQGLSTPPILGQQESPIAELHLSALGSVHIIRAGHELTTADWKYAKVQELFWYLVSRGESTKERIGLALWPDASPAQLRNNLHDALATLRHALGDSDWIVYRDKQYHFNRQRSYHYDVETFEGLLTQSRSHQATAPAQAIATLEQAAALYQGEFLATLSVGDWAEEPRDTLRRKQHEALLLLARLQVAQGQSGPAIDTYLRLIEADRLQEVAHRELMCCYARSGERGLALRHYRQFARWMREEMRALPDPHTRALYERLRQGDPMDAIQQEQEDRRQLPF